MRLSKASFSMFQKIPYPAFYLTCLVIDVLLMQAVGIRTEDLGRLASVVSALDTSWSTIYLPMSRLSLLFSVATLQ